MVPVDRRKVPCSRFRSYFTKRVRLGRDVFQNGGFHELVENLKMGRKNSLICCIIGNYICVFFLVMHFCVRVFKHGGRFWPI